MAFEHSHAAVPGRSVWSRPPLLWLRLAYLTALNAVFSEAYRFVRFRYRLGFGRPTTTAPLSQILDCEQTGRELGQLLELAPGKRLVSVFRAGRSAPTPRSHRLVSL